MGNLEWRIKGECGKPGVDPDIFTDFWVAGRIQQAKRICRRCDVAKECLQLAVDTDDDTSIMGGTTPSERKALIENGILHVQSKKRRGLDSRG